MGVKPWHIKKFINIVITLSVGTRDRDRSERCGVVRVKNLNHSFLLEIKTGVVVTSETKNLESTHWQTADRPRDLWYSRASLFRWGRVRTFSPFVDALTSHPPWRTARFIIYEWLLVNNSSFHQIFYATRLISFLQVNVLFSILMHSDVLWPQKGLFEKSLLDVYSLWWKVDEKPQST